MLRPWFVMASGTAVLWYLGRRYGYGVGSVYIPTAAQVDAEGNIVRTAANGFTDALAPVLDFFGLITADDGVGSSVAPDGDSVPPGPGEEG